MGAGEAAGIGGPARQSKITRPEGQLARSPAPAPASAPASAPAPERRPIRLHGRGRPGNLARVVQGLGRVLVVDDDEIIRQLIAVNLTLEGFEVLTAVDGRDCLDKVTDASPDVITLDVMMPRLDGWV